MNSVTIIYKVITLLGFLDKSPFSSQQFCPDSKTDFYLYKSTYVKSLDIRVNCVKILPKEKFDN